MTRPKLLLADDSVTIRKVVELTFADEGIDVTSVGDATSAMRSFVEMQPDIVLVDAGLAETNGYKICEMIKSDDATKHIPVMLLAGSFEPFDADEAHRVGADGFMTKPFHSIRDLVARVWTLLRSEDQTTTADLSGMTGTEPAAATEPKPETSDIDSLYASSFADTAEMEHFETVDISDSGEFGDPGMDDEMIEASYISSGPEDDVELDLGVPQPASPSREFDWSPDAIVSTSPAPPAHEKELDPSEWLEEEDVERSPEEELIFNPAGKTEEPQTSPDAPAEDDDDAGPDLSSFETIEFSNVPAVVPVPFSVHDKEDDAVLDTAPSTEAEEKVSASDPSTDEIEEGPDSDPAIHETIPYAVGEQPPMIPPKTGSPAVDEEVIDQIVKRVVEKLSDSVVREIALVEVPRIAEKLMREALNQDRKS